MLPIAKPLSNAREETQTRQRPQDVEHSWNNIQTRGGGGGPGGGLPDLKRSRRFRSPQPPGTAAAALAHAAAQQQQSGFSFRVENFFCFGSPLSVFLTLRWRDPSNQGGRKIRWMRLRGSGWF